MQLSAQPSLLGLGVAAARQKRSTRHRHRRSGPGVPSSKATAVHPTHLPALDPLPPWHCARQIAPSGLGRSPPVLLGPCSAPSALLSAHRSFYHAAAHFHPSTLHLTFTTLFARDQFHTASTCNAATPAKFCTRFDISLSLHICSLAPHWLVSSLARSATPIHTTHPSAAHELRSDLVAQQRRSTLQNGRSRFSPAPTSVSRTGPPEHHLLDQHLAFRTESGPPQTPVGGSRRSRFR